MRCIFIWWGGVGCIAEGYYHVPLWPYWGGGGGILSCALTAILGRGRRDIIMCPYGHTGEGRRDIIMCPYSYAPSENLLSKAKWG